MISYAQNFEDVILRRVFGDRTDGFYIDVGAADPVEHSVTKFFYDQGWSGINIEPNDWFYNRLLEQRPRDINLKLATGERDECRSIHMFERIGNSTFVDEHRDTYVELGYESHDSKVRTTTLATICHDYVKREIDFLKVDCEGWEKNTLEGADWERFRPIVVLVEATEPGTPTPSYEHWEPILTEKGRYDMVYFDGLNRFYLRREYADLRRYFDVPPNVFDDFTPYGVYTAERQVEELLRGKEALSNEKQLLSSQIEELEQLRQILQRERDEQALQLGRSQEEMVQLRNEASSLQQELLRTRLWVGRLSQEIAAAKSRVRSGAA